MNNCPCCSHTLLQHVRTSGSYWFCRHCWQEMPILTEKKTISLTNLFPEPASRNQETPEQSQTNLPSVHQPSPKEWIGVEDLSELIHASP